MITIRPATERGHTKLDWLDSRHTFSFGDYYDPRHVGFRHLRVINEDRVQPGRGFAMHGHGDMEIVTWVLAGVLEHKDSLGTGSVIRPGEAQRMSAGTGITHSEFNHSATEPVHFLQIWIVPARRGLPPSYEQRAFSAAERQGVLRLIGAGDARANAVTIHQDVDLYAGTLTAGDRVGHDLRPARHAWLQVAGGSVTVNGTALSAGDGAASSGEERLEVVATERAEVLLFDLA